MYPGKREGEGKGEREEDNHRQIKKNLCRGGSAPIKLQQIKYGGNTSSGKMADQNKTTKHNRATKWAATTTGQRRSAKGCSVWAAATFSEGSKRAQTVKLTPPFGKREQEAEEKGRLMAATCCRELKQKVTHRPPQGSRGQGARGATIKGWCSFHKLLIRHVS